MHPSVIAEPTWNPFCAQNSWGLRLQGTTVDDIAQRADVGPRTFFRYFPTKEAVLFADAVAQRERMTKHLDARPQDEHPFLSLTEAAGVLADEIAARPDDIKLRSRVAAENPAVWAYERTMLEADLMCVEYFPLSGQNPTRLATVAPDLLPRQKRPRRSGSAL